MQQLFSVIIPTWKRTNVLLDTLAYLARYKEHIKEIIVFIDGDDNETQQAVNNNYPQVVTIRSDRTLGPGGGRNLLLNAASSEFVLSIDDDSYPVTNDFFERAIATLNKYPAAGIVSCCIYHRHEQVPQQVDSITEEGFFEGCGCVYRKVAFTETAGYIPVQWAYGVEELDMSLQMLDRGWKIIKDSQLIVFHNTNLQHHQDPNKTAAAIANRLLLAYLRFPGSYFWLGGGMFFNRIFWSLKHKRFNGIIKGLLETPIKLYRYRNYRHSVKSATIKKWRALLSNSIV